MKVDHQVLMYHMMSSAQLNSRVVHFFVVSSVPCLPNVFTMFGAARKLSFHRFHSFQNLSVTFLCKAQVMSVVVKVNSVKEVA